MECPTCKGKDSDCPECKGERGIKIVGCPQETIPREAWDVYWTIDVLKSGGGWPNGSGGWLNEPHSLVEAVRIARSEEALFQAQAMRQR